MKKIGICSTGLVITVMLLLIFPAGSFAAFSDTVVPESGSDRIDNPWVHTLEPVDFGLSSLNGVVITDATLLVNLYAEDLEAHPVYLLGMAGTDTYIGYRPYFSGVNEYTFPLTSHALDLLNESYDPDSDCFELSMLVTPLPGESGVVITSAELSGSASHTPIPSAALLLGTGLVGLISFRRQRMKL